MQAMSDDPAWTCVRRVLPVGSGLSRTLIPCDAVNKLLRYAGAGSAYLAPPLLLISDILLIQFISEPGLFVQRIALIVFIPAIAAVVVLAHRRARLRVCVAAALAIFGALAIVIRQGFLAGPMRPPAVLFPLGLLVLSAAMLGTTVSHRIAALIAAGALLFPLAHMSGAPAALIGGDVMFLAAFWSLATQMTRVESRRAVESAAYRG
jgi:hypothetical protein